MSIITNLGLVHSIWFNAVEDMNVAEYETVQRRLTHSHFSSTKFSLCYLSNRIPPTVRESSLSQASDLYWELETAIEEVVDFVNGNGLLLYFFWSFFPDKNLRKTFWY